MRRERRMVRACAERAWHASCHALRWRTAYIFTRLVDSCWTLFRWTLFLTVAAALAAGGYLYYRLDDEIRRQVQQRLAKHYSDLEVHVGRARFEQDRGIAIYDLSLMTRERDGAPQPLVTIQEMYLGGKLRMEEMLTGEPNIERIVIRRVQIRALRERSGIWNLAAALPLPKFSDQCPIIAVENAVLTLEDSARPGAAPLTIRDLDLTMTPVEAAAGTAAAQLTPRYRVLGTVAGLPAREFRMEGEIGPVDGTLHLTFVIADLEVTPELLAAIPLLPKESLRSAEVSGRADSTLRIARQASGKSLEWTANIAVDRGRLAHAALPEPVTDMELTATADPRGLFVEKLTGKCGSARITLACRRAGWSANAPLGLAARFVGLSLDERVKAALPESCARIWQRFQPKGQLDAEVRLEFDGEAWRPKLAGELRGISLTDAEKFPYPLEQATGKFEYSPVSGEAPDRLQLDLTAIGAGRPVRITADLTHVAPPEAVDGEVMATGVATAPSSGNSGARAAGYRGVPGRNVPAARPRHPVGWVEIAGTQIPLHEQLIAALPEQGEKLVRSLRPQGSIDFAFRAEWKDRSQPRANITNKIQLHDCTIQYDRFSYPLYHVTGLVTEEDRRWTLHDIEARGANDAAMVVCRGESTPLTDGCRVGLTFRATNVPLDDNLKRALPPSAQQAWDELRPQGRVDFTANVIHETGQPEPLIEVVLQPRERSVSIQPQKFSYRLEQLEGTARYREKRVDVENVLARHDRVVYSASAGTWQPTPDGGWQFQLHGVNADRLVPHRDRDLLTALPPALQTVFERLQPTGTFGVYNSSVTLAKSPRSERLAVAWDVGLDCHQAALRGDFALQSLTGGIRLVGRNDGQAVYTAGEVAIDSLVWKDMQFTNVRGPLWVDQTSCLFGELASQRQGQPARRLTADAYGGSIAANIAVQHTANSSYRLDVALGGASLTRFANERLGGPSDLSGTVSGKLMLTGTGRSTQTLSGSGDLHVVDANIYELPVLVAMLKVLKSRTPNTTAFNRCDMEFDIQGEHIHFRHLNLLGDAYSLYGQGATNFRRELDLVFYTLIGPADLPIPLWKTIAGQVSQQGLQLKVVGTLDKPDIQRKALPAVNDALQQLQTGIQEGAATMAPSTAALDAITK